MTITSLAILFAAISVATTMTMVQADITGNLVTITITSPAATPIDVTEAVADAIEYDGILDGVDALVTYSDTTVDGVITSTAELEIDNPGVNLSSGDVFTFADVGDGATVLFTDGVAPGTLDGTIDNKSELSITDEGDMPVVEGQESITGANSELTVDIDASNEVWIELPAGPGTLDDIVITIDTISWNPDTGAIGAVECTTSTNTATDLLFDENTLQFTLSSHTGLGDAIAVHCNFTPSHGELDKTLNEPCFTNGVLIKRTESQQCSFHISYIGARATIIDTLPAEWNATTVAFNPVAICAVDVDEGTGLKGKNKKGNKKSATGITCEDVTILEMDVTVDTRESPGKGHAKKNVQVFKPTSCDDLPINSGAKAILLDDVTGEPVLGTLDGLPIVLDSTDALLVTVVTNDIDPNGPTCPEI